MKHFKKKRKFLICLGGGISQLPLIISAKNKNYQLIVIDKNKKAPGKKFAEIFLNISTENTNKIIKKLNELKIYKKMIKGVINRSSGNTILTMSKIQKKFQLNGSIPRMVKKTLDKNDFIVHCVKNNILVPKLYKKKGKNIPFKMNSFSVVVKPSSSRIGKKGISIVNNKKYLKKALNFAKKNSENKSYIIQEKIDGKDLVLLGAVKNKKFIELTTIDEINIIKKNRISRYSYQNPTKNLNLNRKKKF